MALAFSQNGFSAKNATLMGTYTIPSSNVRITLRKGDVSVVLLEFLKRFNNEVESLRQIDTGGYNPRSIIGSVILSNHASGTAVDVNWRKHPRYERNTFTHKQVAAIRNILRFFEGVIRWGGDYKSAPVDEMHFEINASASSVERIADKIRNGGKMTEKAHATVVSVGVLKQGSHGPVVKFLQQRLNAVFPAYSKLKVDGGFGPKTEAVVKEFQRRTRLQPDGVVGPKTKAMLKRYGIIL